MSPVTLGTEEFLSCEAKDIIPSVSKAASFSLCGTSLEPGKGSLSAHPASCINADQISTTVVFRALPTARQASAYNLVFLAVREGVAKPFSRSNPSS